eukprot:scaffold17300_cov94-Isochrysis_galbana.AAC.5
MMSRTIITGAALGERANAASFAHAARAAATTPPEARASITLTSDAGPTAALLRPATSATAAPAAPAAAATKSAAASVLTPSSTPTAWIT